MKEITFWGKTTTSKEFEFALKELEYMEKHPEKHKSFHSVKELIEDLNSGD